MTTTYPNVYPYTLTTLDRVKKRLGITVAGFDDLLNSMINSATDFIEQETNRHFKQGNYVEVQSVRGEHQKFLFVKNPPITTLTKLEYAGGMPTQKNWMEYPVTVYETVDDGLSGEIYVYGKIPMGTNRIRITYTGGYLIDFTSTGDTTKHTLPLAISELADSLVTRAFKRREKNGIQSEAFEQSQITWRDNMDAMDREVMANYTFLRFI